MYVVGVHVEGLSCLFAFLLLLFFDLFLLFFSPVGAFTFSGLCVIGSSTFAAGALLKGTKYMLPLMLLGRLIFGSGNGSLTSKYHASETLFQVGSIDKLCSLCACTFRVLIEKIMRFVMFFFFSNLFSRTKQDYFVLVQG